MRATVVVSAGLLVAVSSARCGSSSRPASPPDPGIVSSGDGNGDGGAGGAGGGGTADECAGLAPDTVGEPSASVIVPATVDEQWSPGASDGAGTLALKMTNDNAEPSLSIGLFDPLGAERGTYQPAGVTLAESVVGQRDGFELSYTDFAHNRGVLAAVDENGSVVATADIVGAVPWPALNDPRGGIVVVLRPIDRRIDENPPIELLRTTSA